MHSISEILVLFQNNIIRYSILPRHDPKRYLVTCSIPRPIHLVGSCSVQWNIILLRQEATLPHILNRKRCVNLLQNKVVVDGLGSGTVDSAIERIQRRD